MQVSEDYKLACVTLRGDLETTIPLPDEIEVISRNQ